MGGSQIYLAAGETLTVEEMMKGISMASANDATVAMQNFWPEPKWSLLNR